jgi:hypothetical protein
MACTNPKKAWKYGQTKNGKQALTFKRPNVHPEPEIQMVSCGTCESCKLSYAAEWATRIVHHFQTVKVGCFLTLTYNEENLPSDKSVNPEEVRLFIKRLRKKIYPQKIKYFACGEYGENKSRPHYHIIVLGYDFVDKRYWSKSNTGHINYRSPTLEKLWTKGHSTIGDVTYESAGYVARYTFKKQKGAGPPEFVDKETGEVHKVTPEFIRMSQGIGKEWWQKYKADTYKDYLNVSNRKNKVPRYYDKQLEKEEPKRLEKIKKKREESALALDAKTPKSLKRQQAEVKKVQTKMLIRQLEKDT